MPRREHRQNPRYRRSVPVELELSGQHSRRIAGHLLDLSLGGALLRMPCELPKGGFCRLYFSSAQSNAGLPGKILRASHSAAAIHQQAVVRFQLRNRHEQDLLAELLFLDRPDSPGKFSSNITENLVFLVKALSLMIVIAGIIILVLSKINIQAIH